MSLTEKQNPDMIQVPKESLEQACRILAEMSALVYSHVQEKNNLLLMSSGYENLDTALGILSGYLRPESCGLVVGNPDTRRQIQAAYASLDAVIPNTADNSPAQRACLQLQAALFSILNGRYADGKAQDAMQEALSAAMFGTGVIDALIEAGPESLEPDYLNKSGQVLTSERMALVKAVFGSLAPKAGIPDEREAQTHEEHPEQEKEA